MSALAPIKGSSLIVGSVVTTSATVGADKTFDPEGFVAPGVARWVDRSLSTENPAGVAIGYPSITLSVRSPTKASRMYKVTAKLDLPTLDVTAPSTASGIQPAPSKAYSCAAILEVMLPERSTLAERQRLSCYLASLFFGNIVASDGAPNDATGTPLVAAITNFEKPYGA